MPLSNEHQDQRERHKVKDFQSSGWYAFQSRQIKNYSMNDGCYHCLTLHILTHGSRCGVSAWIPVSNYLSASAHWCHSFPVITQSPVCQGQVTSRWVWLVLSWALSPILPYRDMTISRQTRHYQPVASLYVYSKWWLLFGAWTIITSESTSQTALLFFHMTMCHRFFTLSSSLQEKNKM